MTHDQKQPTLFPPTATPLKRYRVVAIEWLSHRAEIEAESPEDADPKARDLFENNVEHEPFSFEDSGLDGVVVEEIPASLNAPRRVRPAGIPSRPGDGFSEIQFL